MHGGGEEPSEEPIADRYNPAARLALFVLTAAVAIAILLIIEITRPVPITVALLTCIFVPFVTFVMPWRKPTVALARAWHLAVTWCLPITAIAVWLGLQDVIWPESLPAQILGVFFTAAGTITLVGALLVAARRCLPRLSGRWAMSRRIHRGRRHGGPVCDPDPSGPVFSLPAR